MNAMFRNLALPALIVLLIAAFPLASPGQAPGSVEIAFSQFLNEIEQGRVRDVVMQGSFIDGTLSDGRNFSTYAPADLALAQRLAGKGATVSARPLGEEDDDRPFRWLPLVLAIVALGLVVYFFRILLRIQAALEQLSRSPAGTVASSAPPPTA